MLYINKKELTNCLQNSKLCKSFDDKIVIPKQYMVTQLDLDLLMTHEFDFNEWAFMLNKLRYWMVDTTPLFILQYISKNHQSINKEDIDKLVDAFYDFYLVKDIKIMYDYVKRRICSNMSEYENKIDTINLAIKNNSIGLIDYIGLLKNSTLTSLAVRHDNLEMLKYLHENGCEISKYSAVLALYYDRVACVKYIFDNSNIFTKYNNIGSHALTHKNKEISDYVKEKIEKYNAKLHHS